MRTFHLLGALTVTTVAGAASLTPAVNAATARTASPRTLPPSTPSSTAPCDAAPGARGRAEAYGGGTVPRWARP